MADSQVGEFCQITGATRERAEFFLQAAEGNLQAAMDAYYGDYNTESVGEGGQPQQSTEQQPQSSTTTNDKPVSVSKKSGLATLSDYQSTNPGLNKGEEEGENYYAGGSEHSGQMISGPPRKKKDIAKEVFEAAKEHGAVPLEEPSNQKPSPNLFQGSGFRLGDTEGPSAKISGAPVPSREKVLHILRFWKDGFSVDDGPLRNGQAPEDKAFLESVSKGQIPMELVHAAKGDEVDINLEDKRNETYVTPKPRLVAFSGEGRKLGNLTPEVRSDVTPPTSSPVNLVAATVRVDTSKPVTSLQIRLADGTRLQSKFNHSHTIGDIRRFIQDSHPSSSTRQFLLLTTFPRKELTNDSQTLSDAQILNAVVVQRFV